MCNECSCKIRGAQPLNCRGLSQAVFFSIIDRFFLQLASNRVFIVLFGHNDRKKVATFYAFFLVYIVFQASQ